MVIKKLKTEPKSTKKEPLIKESAFQKITRLREEKEAAEKKASEQKIIDDAKELERQYSILFPHLDKLADQLKEKKLNIFWAFPDRTGFKKYDLNFEQIQEMTRDEPEKYGNRHITEFKIMTTHRRKNLKRGDGTNPLVLIRISTRPIDKNGKFVTSDGWACVVAWDPIDFKVSKITFKLLDIMMRMSYQFHISAPSFTGLGFHILMKHFVYYDKKTGKKFGFEEALSPLAGL